MDGKKKTDGKYCACRRSENVMNQKSHCYFGKSVQVTVGSEELSAELFSIRQVFQTDAILPSAADCSLCTGLDFIVSVETIKDLDATNYLDRK